MTRVALAAAALAVIILGGREVRLSTAPRGLRNNNPGNIRETTGALWVGQTGTDGEFAIFAAPEYGVRALARVLMTYQHKHDIDTVRGLVNRYAPSTENNTSSYEHHICQALGVEPLTTINIESRLPELVRVIIRHENGQQPYSAELIAMGLAMAKEPISYA